ncbi:hypothetical protein [Methylacidimicrobium sp. B4]|uniref:hypothetical protein n=1 Tax=Methylacidimicrobium sp. B4 TaxID=2796139 RepID=UPI001A8F5B40|nr:hypothetical protein [Methylacidimicrobium sp. B4]QSR84321.1 hypothetical protein MacB4_08835 [Methylacidimicrobium sp. B4]
MTDMESQKPVVIPVDVPKARPSVVPYGGIGGLLFWISVSVFLGISTFHFYDHFTARDREARALQGDSELLRSENQKLRSVVDQLQTELSQTGSLLRLQQDLLGQTAAVNGAGEAIQEKPRTRTPSGTLELRTLEERLDKAFAARVLAKEAAILPQESGVVIALDYRVLFPGPGLKIGAPGQALLHEVAAGLQPLSGAVEVRIVGFVDPTPAAPLAQAAPGARKNPMSNWGLSSLRSAAVARVLVDGEHLAAGRVTASCRGAENRAAAGVGSNPNPGLSAHRLEIGLFLTEHPPGEGAGDAGGSAGSSERQDGR